MASCLPAGGGGEEGLAEELRNGKRRRKGARRISLLYMTMSPGKVAGGTPGPPLDQFMGPGGTLFSLRGLQAVQNPVNSKR
jgi:hypothetical protein